jgi:hypothetical protein
MNICFQKNLESYNESNHAAVYLDKKAKQGYKHSINLHSHHKCQFNKLSMEVVHRIENFQIFNLLKLNIIIFY